MSLEREDLEWLDKKFSEVHEKIGKNNTMLIERVTKVEEAIKGHKHPCDTVVDLKASVQKNRSTIVAIMMILASGGATGAIWHQQILKFLTGGG